MDHLIKSETSAGGNSHAGDGWKKVVHRKRHQKKEPTNLAANGGASDNIFRNEILANGDNVIRASMVASDVEDESNGAGAARNENLNAEETTKLLVSLPQAAAKIDPSRLADFLALDFVPELQLVRFCSRLVDALSEVSFPWVKMFEESPLSTLIDVPLSHIPKPIYEISVRWIQQRTIENLWHFVSWAGTIIVEDLAAQQGGAKGEKKGAQHTSSKSKVGIFVLLAMVLRSRPDALIIVLPMLRGKPRYQGQDKLPFIVWMMAQASQGDLSAGLYSWAHNLLPLVGNKKCCSPQSMDLILQLAENILSNPEARTILVNGAVREGERLIPLPSFEILLQLTFPARSARVKATERFEAIYPLLKEVALAPVRSNRMKEIFFFSLKLAGEGNPVLVKEAIAMAIWSLTENADCFRDWDSLYTVNLEASVALLRKLVDELKGHPLKLSTSPRDTLTLSQTMKSFMLKNEKAITEGGANCSLYEEADKSCKVILEMISGRLQRGSGRRFTAITTNVLVAAVGAAATTLVLYSQ